MTFPLRSTTTDTDVTAAPSASQSVAAWHSATKRFGTALALDALTLELRRGEITALLGPNGAGKTTAVRLLLGLARPTSGRVSLLGGVPDDLAVRRRVGAMLQVSRVPDTLTVAEHLRLFSSYYPAPRPLAELLAIAGLEGEVDRRFGELSGGQRQRVLFAVALCGNPEILVLDEPTVGMDVAARRSLWAAVRGCARAGCAVLLTTHYLDEADALAHRIVVLRSGRVVADDTPRNLRYAAGTRELRCATRLDATALGRLPGVSAVQAASPRAVLICTDADAALRALLTADPTARDVEVVSPPLEDTFLALTGTASSSEAPPADRRSS